MDDSLKFQAETLGIKVDGRWSDERLQQEINKAQGGAPVAPKAAAGRPLPFRINRDFWDEAGERYRKGSIVEMSAEEALDGVESGALSRVK